MLADRLRLTVKRKVEDHGGPIEILAIDGAGLSVSLRFPRGHEAAELKPGDVLHLTLERTLAS